MLNGLKTQEMFRKWFTNNLVNFIDDMTDCQLFLQDLNHNLLHIYIKAPVLFDFFKVVEVKDLEGFKKYIRDNGSGVVANIDDDMQTLTEGITFAVCVHLPCVSQGYVFAYTLYTATGELHIFVNHGMEQFHLSSNEIENKKSVVYTDPE